MLNLASGFGKWGTMTAVLKSYMECLRTLATTWAAPPDASDLTPKIEFQISFPERSWSIYLLSELIQPVSSVELWTHRHESSTTESGPDTRARKFRPMEGVFNSNWWQIFLKPFLTLSSVKEGPCTIAKKGTKFWSNCLTFPPNVSQPRPRPRAGNRWKTSVWRTTVFYLRCRVKTKVVGVLLLGKPNFPFHMPLWVSFTHVTPFWLVCWKVWNDVLCRQGALGSSVPTPESLEQPETTQSVEDRRFPQNRKCPKHFIASKSWSFPNKRVFMFFCAWKFSTTAEWWLKKWPFPKLSAALLFLDKWPRQATTVVPTWFQSI